MFAMTSSPAVVLETPAQRKQRLLRYMTMFLFVAWAMLFMIDPAFATGTGTTSGTGGAGAAQTRVTQVATGWQNIIMGIGVVVLIIAWAFVGYQIAFQGKTMKDMGPVAIGTSVAGLAPVLVGWMFS
jgi:hypothetical protein